jgi:hypothetical protein
MVLTEEHLLNQIEIKQVRAVCCIDPAQKKEELRDEAAYIMLLLAKMELEESDAVTVPD